MSELEKRKNILIDTRKLKISGMLILVSATIFGMSKYIPGFADLYNKYIYDILVNIISRGFSLVPFSVYEIILYIFMIYIFIRIIKYIYLWKNKKLIFKEIVVKSTANFLMYISVFIFLSIMAQSTNSFKSDFVTLTNLKIQNNSEKRLIELCENFKDKINELDKKIDKDEYGFFKVNENVKQEGIDNMKRLAGKYPFLDGYYPLPKAYVFSQMMSYQLLMGETTFTIEANYNRDMPQFNIPSTICHELSHIRGFNNENEANYISFLACINSDNYDYQYSGYLMAYSYCMNDLYNFNIDAFKKINNELSDNVKAEFKNEAAYWNRYKGGISKLYNNVYDVLLKIGGQEEGIKSYNGVVKLIISGYKVQFE